MDTFRKTEIFNHDIWRLCLETMKTKKNVNSTPKMNSFKKNNGHHLTMITGRICNKS